MENNKFMTIREVAKTGILPESYLRGLEKQGKLPGFYSGNTFRVNYQMLIAYLDKISQREGVE